MSENTVVVEDAIEDTIEDTIENIIEDTIEEPTELSYKKKLKIPHDIRTALYSLYKQYEGNDYILAKIANHIQNQLPIILDNAHRSHISRRERHAVLHAEQDSFIQQFLNKNNFYYVPATELFFCYDGKHYTIMNEDRIQYEALSTITQEKVLMTWKHKTKNTILKQIKSTSPLTSIPNSYTIQNVLGFLTPMFFPNKTSAKHFLTVIGDNLLKKHEQLNYIISSKSKQFLTELGYNCYTYFGNTSCNSTFKHKYYDHEYAKCRLINIQDSIMTAPLWTDYLKNNAIDFLCVAAHYSKRFHSADEFLQQHCNDDALSGHVLYLYNNNEYCVVSDFVQEYIEVTHGGGGHTITWKNMLFLWKRFLEKQNIPNILFNSAFKEILSKYLTYSEKDEVFTHSTSKYLPIISRFITFWNDNIVVMDGGEFEVDEISLVFKKWNGKNTTSINEQTILEILRHFYPDIIVEKDKYIQGISCSLWDKQEDLNLAYESYRTHCIDEHYTCDQSLDALYQFYCKLFHNKHFIVSKQFFEKYFQDEYPDFVDENGTICVDWWK